MILSMTAFASSERTDQPRTVAVEIRAYNSRYLDVTVRLPHGYSVLEEKIKVRLARSISRGRIEISVQIKEDLQEAMTFDVDLAKARAYYESLRHLKEHFSLPDPVSLTLLANASGIIRPVEQRGDMDACWQTLAKCLDDTLETLVAMRRKEGDFLARDIGQRLEAIGESLGAIAQQSQGLLAYYQGRLKERIAELTRGLVAVDEGRLAQEAAFFAGRSDISEEIVRAESHLAQFRALMESEAPAGRKLNFLLQELNREFNTMSSKTEKAAVSHLVVEVKAELEKIREQVQNIE